MTDEDNEIQELRQRLEELERRRASTNARATIENRTTPTPARTSDQPGIAAKIIGVTCLGLAGLGVIFAMAGNGFTPAESNDSQYGSPTQRAIAASVAEQPFDHDLAAGSGTAWNYRSIKDPMTDKVTHFACTTSTNKARLDWPYSDVTADLCIRQSPRYGLDAMVSLNGDGQIICRSYNNCSVKIRFGEGAQQTFSAADAADGSSNVIFVTNASRFVQGAKTAPTTKIQITLYQAGDQVLEFNTDKLEWPRPAEG